MAKIPGQYANQPELVNAVIEARRIQMDTGDTPLAIEWLMEHHPMSQPSATRVLEHATFQYVAMYPDGHPRLEGLTAELKERSGRSKINQGIRLQIIERDGEQCQHCSKPVTGQSRVLDRKDPAKSETLDNLHLVCRRCQRLKKERPWDEFQRKWQARFGDKYTKRIVDAIYGTDDPQLDEIRIQNCGEAERCTDCRWIIVGDYGLNDDHKCAHCVVGAPRHLEFQFPPREPNAHG